LFRRGAGVVERGGLATALSGVPPKAEKIVVPLTKIRT